MRIDFESLLTTLRDRKKIGQKKYAEYREDEDALPNDVANGKTILSLGWDGDFPGNSGANWIDRWKGFYFCRSSDFEPEGPFESLDAALQVEWFSGVTPNPTIDSTSLPLRKLLDIARKLVADEGDEIDINGRQYRLHAGKLTKAKTAP